MSRHGLGKTVSLIRWVVIGAIVTLILGFPKAASTDENDAWQELKRLPMLPGPRHTVQSPDGRFRLRASFDDPHHRLLLEEPATGTILNLMRVERDVQIGWRSDSELFFVNNDFASNASDCEVFRPFDPRPLVSIAEAVSKDQRIISATEQAILSSHLYFSCVGWLSESRLLVVIYGHYDYADAPAFKNRRAIYDLTTGTVQRVQ